MVLVEFKREEETALLLQMTSEADLVTEQLLRPEDVAKDPAPLTENGVGGPNGLHLKKLVDQKVR